MTRTSTPPQWGQPIARAQVELLATPLHLGHDKAIQPDKAGSVVLHPLFLLAPRTQTYIRE